MFNLSSICMSVDWRSCIPITCVNFSWCEDREGGESSRVRCDGVGALGAGVAFVGIVKSSDRSMAKEGDMVAVFCDVAESTSQILGIRRK